MNILETLKKPFRKKAIKPLIAATTMGRGPGQGDKVTVRIGDEDITAALFHREGSRILYCRFRWNGKIIRKSTNATTRAGALDGARCWIREIARTLPLSTVVRPPSSEPTAPPPRKNRELYLLNP